MHINLRNIFCHLVSDDEFLSIVVNSEEKKKTKPEAITVMIDMVTDYSPLPPSETQSCKYFPQLIKRFLPKDYRRIGVKNTDERNFKKINVSFVYSLSSLLRSDFLDMTLEEKKENIILLEDFLINKLRGNCQIDKVKNIGKVKKANGILIEDLNNGKVGNGLIQSVANIFEINFLIFDFIKQEITFIWSKGSVYPYINFFNQVYCLSYIQGTYEPIMGDYDIHSQRTIYKKLLRHQQSLIYMELPVISFYGLMYLESWNLNSCEYQGVFQMYADGLPSITDLIKKK